MDENTSETAPGGALTSRPRHPTLMAASATKSLHPGTGRVPVRESLRGLLDAVLDRLDVVADRIADAAGLR